MIRGIHHIAIAVRDLDEARRLYVDELGLRDGGADEVLDQQVRVQIVFAGDTRIELLAPTSPSSPIAKFIARSGPGLHHLAYDVDAVGAALAQLGGRGFELIDEQPRAGAHGTRIGFIHPRSTLGVLSELVEEGER